MFLLKSAYQTKLYTTYDEFLNVCFLFQELRQQPARLQVKFTLLIVLVGLFVFYIIFQIHEVRNFFAFTG